MRNSRCLGEVAHICLHPSMPIDINLLRVSRGGNPDIVRQSQKNRFASVELVDEVIELDDVNSLSYNHP